QPRPRVGIVNPSAIRRETVYLSFKCGARLWPLDAGFQPRHRCPAIVTRRKRRRLPENRAAWVIELERRHANDGEGLSIDSDSGTQRLAVSGEQLLPESKTDDRDFVASLYVFIRHKPPTQYRLGAQRQEEIPRCLGNMRSHRVMHSHRVTRSTKVDIILLDEHRVGQVR